MKLTEEQVVNMWKDHAEGKLNGHQAQELMDYLEQHPGLKVELQQNEHISLRLQELEHPTPSSAMDARFEAWMSGYTSAVSQKPTWQLRLNTWWRMHWQPALAFLAIGLLLGALLVPKGQESANLADEVRDMKKMLMLTLIEQPQARDRIKAVNIATELPGKQPDQAVIEALISTLNQDVSNNVRLAALEALMAYGGNEQVRKALIHSIAKQTSPLMQVALADAMVLLQEKSAADSFSQLLDSAQVEESVASKLKSTIATLKSI